MIIKRGSIWIASLNPTIGGEIQKKRPVIILSNDRINESANIYPHYGVVTVIPISSQIQKIRHNELLLEAQMCGLNKDSKAIPAQMRSISIRRLEKHVACLTESKMHALEAITKEHLDL